ncbi:MAG TPA: hypothetical protein VD907_03860 [Verrucomicrobiae bacterium]|nr:hypothetical protein [Verrucomicrobiae bacterium]
MEPLPQPEFSEHQRDELASLLLGERLLTDAEEAAIMHKVELGEPVVSAEALDAIVRGFQTPKPIDPMHAIETFTKGSAEGAALMRTDLQLPRDCRHFEHVYAVVNGHDDFMQLLQTDEERVISRLTGFLQDIFKPVAVKATGSNQAQAKYNAIGVANLLPHISPELLASDAKEAVEKLVNQDFIGGALQGRFSSQALEAFKASFPKRFQSRLDTFMMIAYLADAGAHTIHRAYPDLENNRELRCCIPADHDAESKSLSHLFTWLPDGPLALRHPYRDVLTGMFPESDLAKYFADNHDSQPELGRFDVPYAEAAQADGIWSARMNVPNASLQEVTEAITAFTADTHFPISAYLTTSRDKVTAIEFVRDPSRSRTPSAPPIDESERYARAFSERFDWPLVETPQKQERPDVRACVGLLEGYDKDQVAHPPAEALALLLKKGAGALAVKTNVVTLVSAAYFYDQKEEREVVRPYTERVMVIEANAKQPDADPLAAITYVAGNLQQHRIFAELGDRDRTVALSRAL